MRLCLVLSCLLALLAAWQPAAGKGLDDVLHAAELRREKGDGQILLVTIDRLTIQKYGWPFPREAYAEIVRRLKLAGASTIAFNVIFDEVGPDPVADASLRKTLELPGVFSAHLLSAPGVVDETLCLRRGTQPSLTAQAVGHFCQQPPAELLARARGVEVGEYFLCTLNPTVELPSLSIKELMEASEAELAGSQPFLAWVTRTADESPMPTWVGPIPAGLACAIGAENLLQNNFLRPFGRLEAAAAVLLAGAWATLLVRRWRWLALMLSAGALVGIDWLVLRHEEVLLPLTWMLATLALVGGTASLGALFREERQLRQRSQSLEELLLGEGHAERASNDSSG